MITLYQAGMSTCTQKVRFALEQKGLAWEGVFVDVSGGENYSQQFKALSPKAVIPVLVDGDDVILESNNICLYLDEKYPQKPLMPNTPKARSDVRVWLQRIDEHLHVDCSALTYATAFGPRLKTKYDTMDKLEAYLKTVPDAGRRYSKRQCIVHGTDSPLFETAVLRLSDTLAYVEESLDSSDYLVGNQLSVADIAYSPYFTRLDHLNMMWLWADKPSVVAWYDKVRATKGYQDGIAAFFNPSMMALLNKAGTSAQSRMLSILAR